jgi:sarcosine oxidase
MQASFDVIVLGLGGMGSAAAAHLSRRGQRVLGLERFGPAHAHGSSHGRSRVFRLAYFEDPAYVPLLLRAFELWQELDRPGEPPLLQVTGGLMLGDADSGLVAGSLRSAREHGLAHELLTATELRRRHPQFKVTEDTVALLDHQAGYVDPEASVRAHLRLAAAAGAELRFDEPVRAWSAAASGDRVQVRTDRGVYEAGRLVITPGPWAPTLLAELALPLRVERHVLFWFDPAAGVSAFAPPQFPVYIWERRDGIHVYGFPHQPGPPGGVKVAFFHAGQPCTPETIERAVSADEAEAMRACLRNYLPGLVGPLLHATTCMYTKTPDGHFIVARHPRHASVVIGSPCSGHGFKFVPVIGEILADLAISGTTRHPIRLFDPARFAVSA